MKKIPVIVLTMLAWVISSFAAVAQCSICTKTAQQMGEKPAIGLNNGILYLAVVPFVIMGILGYRWWMAEKGR